jgi:GGDEF domain-containing protein
MREITQMQLSAARYSNPLTQLPGNVPIQEHLAARLDALEPFVVSYWDLDHFKPYNDVYGYRRGDELIQWTGELLKEEFLDEEDFIGHVGGDDFIGIFLETNWEKRICGLLARFEEGRHAFFNPQDLEHGGYDSENRRGESEFHPIVSLSVGLVMVLPSAYGSPHDVAAAASAAKKMAKRRPGSSYFIERRTPKTNPVWAEGF